MMNGKKREESPKGQLSSRSQELKSSNSRVPTLGVREKLIVIFLLVKVLPLVLLAYIAWQALISLGTISRETAVADSRKALTALAVENIERISTDAAQKVAEFLYQRDADITLLAEYARFYFDEEGSAAPESSDFLSAFGQTKTGLIRQYSDWKIDDNGMGWEQTDPYVPPKDREKRSANTENEDEIDGTAFNYRPPYGFGDDPKRFLSVPLYDEIALLDKNGKQIAKYVAKDSTKKRHPFPTELLDVSDSKNTFVKAERYFEELAKLGKDDIYVSDVIGAYTPSRFIGMYTPDSLASRRIDAKITELEKESDGKITDTSWNLRVLNAELKDDKEAFNSHMGIDKRVRNEIDRRLGKGKTWNIANKSLRAVSEELKTLGFSELATEILNIPFTPENEAFAGAENPKGIRFEGIVRWVKPVFDENDDVLGYATFALNHDHLLEMIDHITPMPERYTELSDAFHGNYAFIWDYQCRSIVHPRHYSICGYNPETGLPETPWLEKMLYDGMIAAGFDRANWQDYIATLTDYVPWVATPDWVKEKIKNKEKWSDEEKARLPINYQGRMKTPAIELTKQGLVGLDGRYLNNAPQCTGWMDLTRDGGSGSFYILWSGLYKLTTASTIPYYTGQYSPEVRGNKRGFGFVAIGAGVDDFTHPANEMGEILEAMVDDNVQNTTYYLVWTTVVLSIIVIIIAIWMAAYLSQKLQWLIDGITLFRSGRRNFRFGTNIRDEFGRLANSFDEMAENIVQSVHTPLVITDMNLNIIYASEQCAAVMGTPSPDEIVGLSYKD
jgi:PAS domain-containing protein